MPVRLGRFEIGEHRLAGQGSLTLGHQLSRALRQIDITREPNRIMPIRWPRRRSRPRA